MKETKFTDEQIVKILREAESGEQTIAAVCRTHGVHSDDLLQVATTLRRHGSERR